MFHYIKISIDRNHIIDAAKTNLRPFQELCRVFLFDLILAKLLQP